MQVLGERRQSDPPELAPAWCRRTATEPACVGWDRRHEHGPTLTTRRNAIQLSVRRRRATRPATASAITVVMASPGRNHGRTPARVLKGSPALMADARSNSPSRPASLPQEYRPTTAVSDAAWPAVVGNHRKISHQGAVRRVITLTGPLRPMQPTISAQSSTDNVPFWSF